MNDGVIVIIGPILSFVWALIVFVLLFSVGGREKVITVVLIGFTKRTL